MEGELGSSLNILQWFKFIELFHLKGPEDEVQIFPSFQSYIILMTNPVSGLRKVT